MSHGEGGEALKNVHKCDILFEWTLKALFLSSLASRESCNSEKLDFYSSLFTVHPRFSMSGIIQIVCLGCNWNFVLKFDIDISFDKGPFWCKKSF